MIEHVLRIEHLVDLQGPFNGLDILRLETARNQLRQPSPNLLDNLFMGHRGLLQGDQHMLYPLDNIDTGIDQGAIKIVDDELRGGRACNGLFLVEAMDQLVQPAILAPIKTKD